LHFAVFKDIALWGQTGAATSVGDEKYHLKYEMTTPSSLYFLLFDINRISTICVKFRSN
jgi:hypothetical protein